MSEFWKRKIRKYFSIFDFDSDGLLSENDIVGMAIGFSKFQKADKQMEEHLKTQLLNVWELLIKNADVGDRCTLTSDDFIVSIGKQLYDPELMKCFSAMIRCLHDMLDVNRDGYLQEDEHEKLLLQLGVPDPSFVKVAFKAIDVDGDGRLSIDEFVNAFYDFIFSEDENSPNAFFFGPLDD